MRIFKIAQFDDEEIDEESFLLELHDEITNDEKQADLYAIQASQYSLIHYGVTSGRKIVSKHPSQETAIQEALRLLINSIQNIMTREGTINPRLPLHHSDFKIVGPDQLENDLPATAIPPFIIEYSRPGNPSWRVSYFEEITEDEGTPQAPFTQGSFNEALTVIRNFKRGKPNDRTLFRIIDSAGCVAMSTEGRESNSNNQIIKLAINKPPSADQMAEKAYNQSMSESMERDVKIAVMRVMGGVGEGFSRKIREISVETVLDDFNANLYSINVKIRTDVIHEEYLPKAKEIIKLAKPLIEGEILKLTKSPTSVEFLMPPGSLSKSEYKKLYRTNRK